MDKDLWFCFALSCLFDNWIAGFSYNWGFFTGLGKFLLFFGELVSISIFVN